MDTEYQKLIDRFVLENDLVYLSEGWDRVVYTQKDREFVFRVSKNKDSQDAIYKEQENLKKIQSQLPSIQILMPEIITFKSLVVSEYPFVKGRRFDEIIDPQQRGRVLSKLCIFINELHSIKPRADIDLDHRDYLKETTKCHKAIQEQIFTKLNQKQREYVDELFGSLPEEDDQRSMKMSLLHTDIAFEHAYYDTTADILTIIDWSDMSYGDTAYEFHHLLRELSKDERAFVREHSNEAGNDLFWQRAWFYRYVNIFDLLLHAHHLQSKEKWTDAIQRLNKEMDDNMSQS